MTLYIALILIVVLKSVDWEHGDEAIFYLLFLMLIITSLAGLYRLIYVNIIKHRLMIIPLFFHGSVILYIIIMVTGLVGW